MGIDPFMVSSSILCICAQRLGRRLCSNCKVKVEDPPKEELLNVGFLEEDFEKPIEIYEPIPSGCARCTAGYKGRFPILETLSMSARLRRMVVEGKSKDELKLQAIEEGMLTLRRVGTLNVLRGITSVPEVLRITLDD